MTLCENILNKKNNLLLPGFTDWHDALPKEPNELLEHGLFLTL